MTRPDFDELSQTRRWTAEQELLILRGFIADKGLDDELAAYARARAAEENGHNARPREDRS